MKKTLGFVAVVALSGLITVSCSSLNKMKKRAGEITYSVTPETLVAKGGMVDLKIDVTFPAKYFNKKVAIEATPVLRFKGIAYFFILKSDCLSHVYSYLHYVSFIP